MKQFTIKQNSTLPYLEIEPIKNGRYDFKKLFVAIQAADITFTMTDVESGIKKIANAPCEVVSLENDCSCTEGFKIQYRWNKRDTKQTGQFKGEFKITFTDDVVMDGMVFPKGELIVPISETLLINVR